MTDTSDPPSNRCFLRTHIAAVPHGVCIAVLGRGKSGPSPHWVALCDLTISGPPAVAKLPENVGERTHFDEAASLLGAQADSLQAMTISDAAVIGVFLKCGCANGRSAQKALSTIAEASRTRSRAIPLAINRPPIRDVQHIRAIRRFVEATRHLFGANRR